MDAFTVVSVLTREPYMKWIIVPEGLRKEEIADLLKEQLGWEEERRNEFLSAYRSLGGDDYREGVYFPDTYLLPVEESGERIADRFIKHFNEKFAPYAAEALAKNIRWTTALKIASIIQREAAGSEDMPLISGVIWNRLLKGMPLQVDATVEYARGDTGSGYWAPLSASDLKIESLYNTYAHAGLPPTPIANPGIPAIEAALRPTTTTCLFYIHDKERRIHCSETYAEQEANIEKYLK